MARLPHTIAFNDLDYPELADILRGIDIGIAAIIASDPAMRIKGRRQRAADANEGIANATSNRMQRRAA
ncbi:MAG: hypothetical protein P0Y65_10040 [Candidatus Devosia phytovorans]|uniref:Uncharacterized protein n=1 Tax=Candidatus Devosia phytovorans TaxID=3121372 RepID=A0AAJ5VZS8_9HYPH|nr:hypothetical protein [Devosia sp.]WEK06558.1 MAG: hypothetical protein P0Y65_10040 [Devosia sp.]